MRSYYPNILTLALSITLGSFPCLAQWKNVGSPGFTTTPGYFTSLALDNADTPYIVYSDMNYPNCSSSVMKFDGTSWILVGNSGFATGCSHPYCLAFDKANTPYIAYAGRDVVVVKLNNNVWTRVGYLPTTTSSNYCALATDSLGLPYVVFNDSITQKASVVKFDGVSWSAVGNRGFTTGVADWPSIAFAPDGTLYVACRVRANSSATYGAANAFRFNNNVWSSVGPPDFSADNADYTKILIDKDGIPFVAYEDFSTGGTSVMKFAGGSWQTLGAIDSAGHSATLQAFAIGRNGVLYIAGVDPQYGVMVYQYNGSHWMLLNRTGLSGKLTSSLSLVLSSRDVPYVAYSDSFYGNKVTVQHLDNSDISTPTAINAINYSGTFKMVPNPSSKAIRLINVPEDLNGGSGEIFDSQARKVLNFVVNDKIAIDISGIPTGVFIIRFSNGATFRLIKQP